MKKLSLLLVPLLFSGCSFFEKTPDHELVSPTPTVSVETVTGTLTETPTTTGAVSSGATESRTVTQTPSLLPPDQNPSKTKSGTISVSDTVVTSTGANPADDKEVQAIMKELDDLFKEAGTGK